jgi:competence protein ComGC
MKDTGKAFAFLEILLVLMVISFLVYIALKTYFKKLTMDKDTEKFLSEQGVDTRNQKAILDSVKDKVRGINKQQLDYEKNIGNIIFP